MAERVLEHINETIREHEGKERLKEISKDLWVGQGCVPRSRKLPSLFARVKN